jgi:hypothetical protein
MVNNHENCKISFGYGMEPKIFWSAYGRKGCWIRVPPITLILMGV